jgi:hypothetical protein
LLVWLLDSLPTPPWLAVSSFAATRVLRFGGFAVLTNKILGVLGLQFAAAGRQKDTHTHTEQTQKQRVMTRLTRESSPSQ